MRRRAWGLQQARTLKTLPTTKGAWTQLRVLDVPPSFLYEKSSLTSLWLQNNPLSQSSQLWYEEFKLYYCSYCYYNFLKASREVLIVALFMVFHAHSNIPWRAGRQLSPNPGEWSWFVLMTDVWVPTVLTELFPTLATNGKVSSKEPPHISLCALHKADSKTPSQTRLYPRCSNTWTPVKPASCVKSACFCDAEKNGIRNV